MSLRSFLLAIVLLTGALPVAWATDDLLAFPARRAQLRAHRAGAAARSCA